jgi:hypothetical protein
VPFSDSKSSPVPSLVGKRVQFYTDSQSSWKLGAAIDVLWRRWRNTRSEQALAFMIERAHALIAGRIGSNIQRGPECQSLIPIDNVRKAPIAKVSNRPVKKARPDRSVRLYNGGNPGGVTKRRLRSLKAQLRTKVTCNPAKLRG